MTVTQAWKEAEQGTREQWDKLTQSLDISLESLNKRWVRRERVEETIVEMFPNLVKTINSQVQ